MRDRFFFLFILFGLLFTSQALALPTTTFNSFQVPNTTDQNITLTCTEGGGTGCKAINYNIDNNSWLVTYSDTNTKVSDGNYYFTTITGWKILRTDLPTKLIPTGTRQVQGATMDLRSMGGGAFGYGGLIYYYTDGTNELKTTGTTLDTTNPPAVKFSVANSNSTKDVNKIEWVIYRALDTNTYNTGADDLNYYMYKTGSDLSNYSFLYSGVGDHNIQYYSTDNSDNNETTKTSTFTTYGNARFRIKDQNSGLDLNGTQINFNGSDYVSGTNIYDFNLQELTATNTSYLFTISKTGYSTRYYQIDLNYLSSFDINFALLPDSLDADVPFKVYETDETTLFTNTYVEVKDSDTNWTVGRLKTNSIGEATFNLRADDSNYNAIIDDGAFTYIPVTVSVLYPKNEETLAQITEKWKIEITQNLYASYSDLNATKIIYLLPNTSLPYNIKISDMNGNYFPRTYAKTYPGNPLTDTLQPYLVATTTGLLTTIRTVSAYTNQPIPDITIKIYKYISGLGKTYVEQVVTDDKGEAITYAVTGSSYEYEIYSGTTLIRIDQIQATSSVVYIKIDDLIYTNPILQAGLFNVLFNPGSNKLGLLDNNLIQTIYLFDYNSDVNIQNIWIKVLNTSINGTDGNDAYIYIKTIPYNDQNTITNWIDINALTQDLNGKDYDTNGYIKIEVIIGTSDGNYTATQYYKPYTGLDPIYQIGEGSRNMFGCTSGNDAFGNLLPCANQLFLALILTFIITCAMSWQLGFTNPSGLALIFLGVLGFFTFITWVPIILYALLCTGTIIIIMVGRSRFA